MVLRNLMRVVELLLVIPPVVILLHPLRQRLGDFAAGTIVVGAERGDKKGTDAGADEK